VTYRFGPFLLSPERRSLERNGSPVALTPKAFDLLVALVRHRSRALSKDEILAMVWPRTQVEEGNLAQQILLLRKALAASGECVATVPRHGYRFVSEVTEVIEKGAVAGPPTSPHCLVWDAREIPLHEGVTVIGRADDADVRIPLPSLSRHHARIVVQGLEATLEDLGSRHGSWREGTAVRGVVTLASGDQIRLGTAALVYCLVTPDGTTRS